jgi:hypothetical protein
MDDQKLREFFQFDEADLASNRAGKLSEKQNKILLESGQGFKKDMRRNGIGLLLVASLGPVLAISMRSLGWGWIIVWGIAWTLIWGLLGWGFVEGSLDKSKFQLASVKGPIKIVKKEGYEPKQRSARVWNDLRVGKKRFEIKGDLTEVLQYGDEYTVYYEKGKET